MKTWIIAAVLGIALSAPAVSSAVAQAGGTGGTVGKTGKSAAGGGEEKPGGEEPRRRPVRSPARHRETVHASTCSKLIGVWKGALGGDLTYKPGGAVFSTVPVNEGRWSCDNAAITVTWTKVPSVDHCTLSADGLSQACTNNAGMSFTRSRKS